MAKRIHCESKNCKTLTVSSLLKNKFKCDNISLISASLSVLALISIASAQLYAAMRVFNVLGLPIKIMLAITTLIIILVSIRGVKGLVKFGKYNLIIATIGALAAIGLAFGATPNLSITSGFERISISNLLWIIIPTSLYILLGQDIHQKLYKARTKKSLIYGCFIAAVALALMAFFPVIIGMKSHFLFSINPSEAVPKFIIFSIPSLFKGLFIAAILAAVIGCAQSVISASASQFSQDIFCFIRKIKSKDTQNINSITTVTIAIIAFLIALYSKGIINNLIIAYSLYTAGMFVPILMALFLKRTKRYSRFIVIISVIGLVFSLLIELNLINLGLPSIIPGIGASIIAFLIVNRLCVVTKKE